MTLLVSETFVNVDEGYRYGDSRPQEACTDDVGELYRFCVRNCGRCTGKVYVDRADGTARHVGWTFLKRREYDDAPSDWPEDRRTYLRETWISVRAG